MSRVGGKRSTKEIGIGHSGPEVKVEDIDEVDALQALDARGVQADHVDIVGGAVGPGRGPGREVVRAGTAGGRALARRVYVADEVRDAGGVAGVVQSRR